MNVKGILKNYSRSSGIDTDGDYYKGITYADGVEVDLDTLTKLPGVLIYVSKKPSSFTLVNTNINNTDIIYGIFCSNYRDDYRHFIDLITVAESENGHEYDNLERSTICLQSIIGDYVSETYGEDYPSNFDAIYRLIRMASPMIVSIFDKDKLISRIESPYQPDLIAKSAEIMDVGATLKKYSYIYRLKLKYGVTYADGVKVDVNTITELPKVLININDSESHILVNTYVNNIPVIYTIYCSNQCEDDYNLHAIDLVYFDEYKGESSMSPICLYPIIGHYMRETYGEDYPFKIDVICKLINAANPIMELIFDKDALISRIESSSLMKRANC